ncbi:MAG: hypothetical protein A3J51_02515 [Omnitrophica WOR_2 bacterium RIFCSPHIGHO2_02_FULL_45_21]|nr:MAG: hypothetical protein A3J51_02515 [Omnitrophica WOR_2 bacterium RIFCSPHIGHO2_02_FULL_45_21]
MNVKKPIVIGGVIGVSGALIAVVLARLNDAWDNQTVRGIINFLAGVPMLISDVKLKLPQLFQNIFFFVYWLLVGGIMGWPLGAKKAAFKALAAVFVIAVIFAHRAVQINLEQELEGALRALGEIFRGVIK